MSKKRKHKELDIQELREYIRKNLDTMSDQTITRLYEAATGEIVASKISNNKPVLRILECLFLCISYSSYFNRNM